MKNRKIPSRRSAAGRKVTAGIRVLAYRTARRNPHRHTALPSPEPDVGSRIVGRPRVTKACIERVFKLVDDTDGAYSRGRGCIFAVGLNKVDD
jgi:hypothetical protein